MGRLRAIVKKMVFQEKTDSNHINNKHHLSSNKQASNEKSITKATYQKTLSDFGDSFDLVHRSFNHDEIHIVYLNSLVDSNTLEWEILSPLREMSIHNLEQSFQQSLFKQENNHEKVIKGILDGNVSMFAGRIPI